MKYIKYSVLLFILFVIPMGVKAATLSEFKSELNKHID